MLDAERDEYASSLANLAATRINQANADPAALELGRRLLALALNLSPHNRRAGLVNQQLSKGELPTDTRGDYSAESLVRLLLTRGKLLVKTASQEDRLLGRMFIQLAAEIDPANKDAAMAGKEDRIDYGNVDWTFLTRQQASVAPQRPAGPAR